MLPCPVYIDVYIYAGGALGNNGQFCISAEHCPALPYIPHSVRDGYQDGAFRFQCVRGYRFPDGSKKVIDPECYNSPLEHGRMPYTCISKSSVQIQNRFHSWCRSQVYHMFLVSCDSLQKERVAVLSWSWNSLEFQGWIWSNALRYVILCFIRYDTPGLVSFSWYDLTWSDHPSCDTVHNDVCKGSHTLQPVQQSIK